MKNNKAPAIACLIALGIIFWVASEVGGAAYEMRQWFVGDYDSVRVVKAKHFADSSVLQSDSFWVAPPKDTTITVDKSYDWSFRNMYYSGGESSSVTAFVKFTAGPATISSDQLQEGAHYVVESSKVTFGDGSYLTGTGTGAHSVTIYAIDTSGTDDSILDVGITVNSIADVFDGSGKTNSNGYEIFTLPADSMVYLGRKAGYTWLTDTVVVSGDATVTLYGYNVVIDPPDDPNLCRVHGWARIPSGSTGRKMNVYLTVEGDEAVHNYCDSTFFIKQPKTTSTDADGYFYFDVYPSKCLLTNDGDSLKYNVVARLGTYESKKVSFYVPDAETYEIEL